MPTDKQVKEQFRLKAMKDPEKHYPVGILKELGFSRRKCAKCGVNFWSIAERQFCGNANCQGGFTFIGNPPTKKKFDYLSTWLEFEKFFVDLGYLSVPRKPVVARWRNDVYWVGASVYGFQPYVVSGEIKPPSNAVIIPQPSLRFNDIDNVGITGSHYVCFDMLGQLHFEKKEDYQMEKYFEEYFNWITKGMGIPQEELAIHEDAWAGGGNFGPCMEFFARGLEIGNQVYMQYEVLADGSGRELNIKVLDMGQGHERVPWISHGTANSYETTFPDVVSKLKTITGIKYDEKLVQKFLPYAAFLNVDEVEDIEKSWSFIAQKIGIETAELKEKILPLQAIYSIAEHSRAALFALHDGALPSNVGGGYNLRIIIRRALDFIEKYDWQIDFCEVAEWNAIFLKPLWPELTEDLNDVFNILEAEKKKFAATKERTKQIIAKIINQNITVDYLIELYDSQGIHPEMLKQEFERHGKKISVPEDFYAQLAARHEQKEQQLATHKKERIELPTNLPQTEKLFWRDWKLIEADANIVAIKDNFVVLDKTIFYPTSGGQLHDIGEINGLEVVEVIEQDGIILHKMKETPKFRIGQKVSCKLDFSRRKQLAQHHTATHIVNLACQKVLGKHCWQAGAAKTVEKARLDITHYEQLSEKQLKELEDYCNEIIRKNLPVKKEILPREVAEEKYGMRIYQGGFIPGRNLRIVSIADLDHEACGGTHLDSTAEVEQIKILNSTRIQDGVIRINYTAGLASKKTIAEASQILEEVATILGVSKTEVPSRAQNLFKLWKQARKALKTGKKVDLQFEKPQALNLSDEELVKETAKIFSTQPEHIPKTAKRFMNELEEIKKSLGVS